MKEYYEYEVLLSSDESYCGVTYGGSFNEALNNVLDFYYAENIVSITLAPWSANGCLIISKEVLEALRNEIV
jgi:hypothetical protein